MWYFKNSSGILTGFLSLTDRTPGELTLLWSCLPGQEHRTSLQLGLFLTRQ